MAATRNTRKSRSTDPILRELEAIKKLVLLALYNQGIKQDALGAALGVDQTTVSRMVPSRGTRKRKK